MSNHTPGPWYAAKDGGIWRRHPSELYGNGGTVAGDMPIAVAHRGWYGELNGYPVESNAALIAAAPDLLAALEYSRRFLNKKDHDIEFVDAAIAKAKGE